MYKANVRCSRTCGKRSKKNDETEDEYKNNLYYYKNYIHILKAKIRTGTETMTRIYGKELCT